MLLILGLAAAAAPLFAHYSLGASSAGRKEDQK